MIQRQGEAYWKERSVIRREDDVDGRASVTKDEERVLRRLNCDEFMQIRRLGGCQNFVGSERSLYSMRSVIFSQCRDRRMGVV